MAKNDKTSPVNELFRAAKTGIVADATSALNAGASVDARNLERETPLHWAAANGHVALARLLVERGADTKAANIEQQTPRDLARKRGHTSIMEMLDVAAIQMRSHAADVEQRRKTGKRKIE